MLFLRSRIFSCFASGSPPLAASTVDDEGFGALQTSKIPSDASKEKRERVRGARQESFGKVPWKELGFRSLGFRV